LACENYDEVKPNKEWLKLTGCELNVMESSYMEENGKVVELFIPARGPGEDEGDPIHVLVADGIEKPGNLGAILRTADAAGAAVLVSAMLVAGFWRFTLATTP